METSPQVDPLLSKAVILVITQDFPLKKAYFKRAVLVLESTYSVYAICGCPDSSIAIDEYPFVYVVASISLIVQVSEYAFKEIKTGRKQNAKTTPLNDTRLGISSSHLSNSLESLWLF
jgi:hypothetical protein